MSGADAITVNVRKLIFTLAAVVAVLFVACSPEPKSDDVVAQTAKVYYDHLLHGQYDHFVDGTYRPDSIPDSYREQLIANARMYETACRFLLLVYTGDDRCRRHHMTLTQPKSARASPETA